MLEPCPSPGLNWRAPSSGAAMGRRREGKRGMVPGGSAVVSPPGEAPWRAPGPPSGAWHLDLGTEAEASLAGVLRLLEADGAPERAVETLARALEGKDVCTGDHSRALVGMSATVGRELGIEGEDLGRLEVGALLHDVGKIGVPLQVIRKPGPLTAGERRLMNLHPEIGEAILERVPSLEPLRPVVRACHERWDGGGYPDGLAREAIPLAARIVFVCDAFHAMTTDRPYRGALPEHEAVRRLKVAAGTQFDPGVVETFVRVHAGGGVGVAAGIRG